MRSGPNGELICESTLLSRQLWRGHEGRRLCTRLVDELCKFSGWRRDARDMPGDPGGHGPSYQPRCRGLDGLRKDPEGIEPMPAPDSYPHVTCGRAVKGQRPQAWRRHRRAATSATMGISPCPDPSHRWIAPAEISGQAIRPGSRWLHGGAAPSLAGERSDGAAGLVAGAAASVLCSRSWRSRPGISPGRSALTLIMARHRVRRAGAGHMERDRGRVRPPGQLPVKPGTRAGDDPGRLGPGGGRVAVTAPGTAGGIAR